MAGVYFLGALSFLLLGTAATQTWALTSSEKTEQSNLEVEVTVPLNSVKTLDVASISNI